MDNMRIKMFIKSMPGIIGFTNEEFASFDNEGWIDCDFSIRVDCFDASFSNQLYKQDLEAFLKNIHNCINGQTTTIEFSTIEEFLYLKGIKQENGAIKWNGELLSPHNTSNKLSFNIESDKSVLHDLSVVLTDILKQA